MKRLAAVTVLLLMLCVHLPFPSLAQDTTPCDIYGATDMGELPLSSVDDLTRANSIRQSFNQACGHTWLVTVDQPARFEISVSNITGIDSENIEAYVFLYTYGGALISKANGYFASISTGALDAGRYNIVASSDNGSYFQYTLSVTAYLEPVSEQPPVVPRQNPDLCTGIVNTTMLNMRSGPSIDYSSKQQVAEATILYPYARNRDSTWLAVRDANGIDGWVNARYLNLSGGCGNLPVIDVEEIREPEPERPTNSPADLYFVRASQEVDVDNNVVYLSFVIGNQGQTSAYNFLVSAEQANWGSTDTMVSLEAGQSKDGMLALNFPTEDLGHTYAVVLRISGAEESDYNNNTYRLTVRLPEPDKTVEPPAKADLAFSGAKAELDPYAQTIDITYTLLNQGTASARATITAQREDTGASVNSSIVSIRAGSIINRALKLPYADEDLGKTLLIRLNASGADESNYDNNTTSVSFSLPKPSNGTNDNAGTFLMIGAGVVIVVGMLFVVRPRIKPSMPTISPDMRRYWQKHAQHEKPRGACEGTNQVCTMDKAEPQYQRYEVESLTLYAQETANGQARSKRDVQGHVLDPLNEVLHQLHQQKTPDWNQLATQLLPMAHAVLGEADTWLKQMAEIQHVKILANIVGSEVEFEFTLYQCEGGIWRSVSSWEQSITDKRTLAVGNLGWLEAPFKDERLQQATQLAQNLIAMLRKV